MNNLVEGAIQAPTNPLFPAACNWMQGASFYGWPYSYRWSLGVRTVAPGTPAKAGQDAVAETVTYNELANGNATMTQEQWEQWTTQPTDEYVRQCVADNLGVTLIPDVAKKSATAGKTTRKAAPTAKRAKKKKGAK